MVRHRWKRIVGIGGVVLLLLLLLVIMLTRPLPVLLEEVVDAKGNVYRLYSLEPNRVKFWWYKHTSRLDYYDRDPGCMFTITNPQTKTTRNVKIINVESYLDGGSVSVIFEDAGKTGRIFFPRRWSMRDIADLKYIQAPATLEIDGVTQPLTSRRSYREDGTPYK